MFGLVYLAVSGMIENGIPGCLVGAYNPNIQPRSTIGYGTPATGLKLVKFVQLTVWLLFIQVAVVKKMGDLRLQMFRVANEQDGCVFDTYFSVPTYAV